MKLANPALGSAMSVLCCLSDNQSEIQLTNFVRKKAGSQAEKLIIVLLIHKFDGVTRI